MRSLLRSLVACLDASGKDSCVDSCLGASRGDRLLRRELLCCAMLCLHGVICEFESLKLIVRAFRMVMPILKVGGLAARQGVDSSGCA